MQTQTMDACKSYLHIHVDKEAYGHALFIMRGMARIAPLYGLDPYAAQLAGLIHDIAKDIPLDHVFRVAKKRAPYILDGLDKEFHIPTYLHGPFGAYMARSMFGIKDADILGAIRDHVGHAERMSLLARCLHTMNAASPTAPFPGSEAISAHLHTEDLDRAELLAYACKIAYFEENDIPVHPGMRANAMAIERRTRLIHL